MKVELDEQEVRVALNALWSERLQSIETQPAHRDRWVHGERMSPRSRALMVRLEDELRAHESAQARREVAVDRLMALCPNYLDRSRSRPKPKPNLGRNVPFGTLKHRIKNDRLLHHHKGGWWTITELPPDSPTIRESVAAWMACEWAKKEHTQAVERSNVTTYAEDRDVVWAQTEDGERFWTIINKLELVVYWHDEYHWRWRVKHGGKLIAQGQGPYDEPHPCTESKKQAVQAAIRWLLNGPEAELSWQDWKGGPKTFEARWRGLQLTVWQYRDRWHWRVMNGGQIVDESMVLANTPHVSVNTDITLSAASAALLEARRAAWRYLIKHTNSFHGSG